MHPFKIILGLGIVLGMQSGCTKTETVYEGPQQFCFEIKPDFNEYAYLTMSNSESKAGLPVEFKICQPPDFQYSYAWNFGDGANSGELYPTHTYTKKGLYTVSLYIKKGEVPVDTLQQTLRVYTGDQYYAPVPDLPTYAVDLTETADKGLLVLGYRPASATDTRRQYFVLKLDSTLQQLWVKDLPATMVNLSCIQPLPGGKFILNGNTNGLSSQYGLTSINEQGTVEWSKTYDLGRGLISFATGTPDGSIVAVGQKPMLQGSDTIGLRNTIIRTTADGILVWENGFEGDEPMWGAENLLVENDGLVIAGNKSGQSCNGKCDSVFITKINMNTGLRMWATAMQWYNSGPLGNSRIIRTGDSYQVSTRHESILFNFTPDGKFRDKQQFFSDTQGPGYQLATADNLSLLLLSHPSYNTWGSIVKLASNSERKWQQSFVYPVSARTLTDGNVLVLGHGKKNNRSSGQVGIVVRKIGVNGVLY